MKNAWRLACASVGLVLSGWAWSAQAEQALLPAQSEITFSAKQLGVPMAGRFKRFTVQSTLDPKRVASSKVAIQIDLGSVSVNPESDAELIKPEWFGVGQFPQARFQSSSIKALGAGRFDIAGQLTIKGLAREVVVPVQLSQAQGVSTATGSFVIKRLDFKVGDGDWADPSVVANEVQVKFKLVLQGMPAQ